MTSAHTSRRFTDSSVSSWMSGSAASGCAPPVSRLINRRIVFDAMLSTGGKLYINGKKKRTAKAIRKTKTTFKEVVVANRVERESGDHLRTETRTSSSMENACVIAIESFG